MGEESPTKIDYRKKTKNGTLILTSLLEDLVGFVFFTPHRAFALDSAVFALGSQGGGVKREAKGKASLCRVKPSSFMFLRTGSSGFETNDAEARETGMELGYLLLVEAQHEATT